LRPNFGVTKLLTFVCGIALLIGMAVQPAAAKTKHKAHKQSASKSAKSAHGKKSKKAKTSARSRGQKSIDSERARQIQEALIREHYLNGEPTGSWDQQTREALVRFQGDNGWQTKVVPDSRALIKLGLGPDRSKVMNPEALNRPEVARDQVPGGGPQ
jgi:peptidoglycan hydrolase-like protein with peptidoglycan-binding domain